GDGAGARDGGRRHRGRGPRGAGRAVGAGADLRDLRALRLAADDAWLLRPRARGLRFHRAAAPAAGDGGLLRGRRALGAARRGWGPHQGPADAVRDERAVPPRLCDQQPHDRRDGRGQRGDLRTRRAPAPGARGAVGGGGARRRDVGRAADAEGAGRAAQADARVGALRGRRTDAVERRGGAVVGHVDAENGCEDSAAAPPAPTANALSAAAPHDAGERTIGRVLRTGALCSGALFLLSVVLEALPQASAWERELFLLRAAAASLLVVAPVVRLIV